MIGSRRGPRSCRACWRTAAGFLLVPIFVLALGLTAARAAGTSLVAAVALDGADDRAHWLLGDIDWAIAGAFALGLVPASMLGARLGLHLPSTWSDPSSA